MIFDLNHKYGHLTICILDASYLTVAENLSMVRCKEQGKLDRTEIIS